MADKYVIENYPMKHKICPLTGDVMASWVCESNDCSNVSFDRYDYVHGMKCYCERDIEEAKKHYEALQNKFQKDKERKEKMLESLRSAKQIDYEQIDDYCKELDKILLRSTLKFDKQLSIMPFVDKDESRLMYLIKDGSVEDIVMTGNVLITLNKWKNKLTDPESDYSFSMLTVPASLTDVVQVNLYIRHKFDAIKILKYDNPVYISKTALAKYIDNVYGWKWCTWKKARERHLELTEIVNGDNLIYIKQEIDEIVRRQTMIDEA